MARPEVLELTTATQLKEAVVGMLCSMQSNELITFADSELGLGCDVDITNEIINALNRGAKVEIVAGPKIIVNEYAKNLLIDYIGNNIPSNLALFMRRDWREIEGVFFHFILSPKDVLVMYTCLPSQGLKLNDGFFAMNTKLWRGRLMNYIKSQISNIGRTEINSANIKALSRMTKEQFQEEEATDEFQKEWKNRFGIGLRSASNEASFRRDFFIPDIE